MVFGFIVVSRTFPAVYRIHIHGMWLCGRSIEAAFTYCKLYLTNNGKKRLWSTASKQEHRPTLLKLIQYKLNMCWSIRFCCCIEGLMKWIEVFILFRASFRRMYFSRRYCREMLLIITSIWHLNLMIIFNRFSIHIKWDLHWLKSETK